MIKRTTIEIDDDLLNRDLLIACTALHHGLGVVHVDRNFERIAQVRPLAVRRLG